METDGGGEVCLFYLEWWRRRVSTLVSTGFIWVVNVESKCNLGWALFGVDNGKMEVS